MSKTSSRGDPTELAFLSSHLNAFSNILDKMAVSVRRENDFVIARTNRLQNSRLAVAKLPSELLAYIFELSCMPPVAGTPHLRHSSNATNVCAHRLHRIRKRGKERKKYEQESIQHNYTERNGTEQNKKTRSIKR